jgi:hypothetical protein
MEDFLNSNNIKNRNYKEKSHFFIGHLIKNENHSYVLRKIQKKLRKKYLLKEYHTNNKLFTNFIYLGYLDEETANIYMQEIISKLLTSISNTFNELICEYTGYKLSYDGSYYKISLNFNDIKNYLEKIIIPYLHENGVVPIYDKKKYPLKPTIDLIYYKESNILGNKTDGINIQIPTDKFKINHISLIKGNPVKIRSGTPSIHDQMNLEEVYKYDFPLKGELI